MKIKVDNPNKNIYYEEGGRLSMWYKNTGLCEGSLPQFYQSHQNNKVLNVPLTDQVQFGSTLMTPLQVQQQTGHIPLDMKVHAPVAVKLERLKLGKVRILGEYLSVVDS